MKEFVQGTIRGVHRLVLNRGLPRRLGIYFHNLVAGDHGPFKQMVVRIRDEGFQFVGIDDYLRAADSAGADRLAFVSFDDNYVDWLEALPLLDRLGISGTFYVNTAPLRDRATDDAITAYYRDRLRYKGPPTSPLNTKEIRQIRDAGHRIGVHSHNHFVLSELPIETAKEEIYVCRDNLEQTLGQRLRHFSYPFGMRRHFSPELYAYCLETGFSTIARATPGLLHQPFDGTTIQRTDWRLSDSFEQNTQRCSIDGRLFERLTGRSAVA